MFLFLRMKTASPEVKPSEGLKKLREGSERLEEQSLHLYAVEGCRWVTGWWRKPKAADGRLGRDRHMGWVHVEASHWVAEKLLCNIIV
jgi:hypothetical protein